MKFLRFEYKITLFYLLAGGLWILFSDRILFVLINDSTTLSEFQTYKGWFYVVVTAIILFYLVKNHLEKRRGLENELYNYQNQLEQMVDIRTEELESAIKNLKETQAHLVQTEKMASLGILTAGVAHEINNPLNYVMGAYEGLFRHYENNTLAENHEEVGVLINALKIGVDRSSVIVKGLNQFSRQSDSQDEVCNIHAIIENSLTMLHNQIKHKINIVKEFAEEDIVLQGNVGNLHQVFINVLGNAVQAIQSKGTISIKTATGDQSATIKISDTGTGISAEHLEKVTLPFFTTKDPGKGTGLGLSITYNIIKEHRGKIDFESEIGKGTTVTIELPKNKKQ